MRIDIYIVSLLLINSLLDASQNSPIFDNKASKSIIAAALIGITAIPSYMYYRWSSKNQKESQKITQDIDKLESYIKSESDYITEIEEGLHEPLPKEYEARRNAAIKPHGKCAQDTSCMNDYAEFQKFVTKYAPPVDAQRDFIKNEKRIYMPLERTKYNEELDRFFVKNNLDINRIVNVERMRKIIFQQQFKYITVPHKYVFFIGNRFLNIADKFKKAIPLPNKLISKDEIEEIANFIEETGYSDFTLYNVFKSSDGKWVFIDTENGAFIDRFNGSCQNAIANLKNFQYYLSEYSSIIGANSMAVEAQTWFDTKITSLENDLKKNKKCVSIVTMRTELDDREINFEAAKRYKKVIDRQSVIQGQLFDIDPFNQKNDPQRRANAIEEHKKYMAEHQEKLGKLKIELAQFQKTWYMRVRDSWSHFWSGSHAQLVKWRLWY